MDKEQSNNATCWVIIRELTQMKKNCQKQSYHLQGVFGPQRDIHEPALCPFDNNTHTHSKRQQQLSLQEKPTISTSTSPAIHTQTTAAKETIIHPPKYASAQIIADCMNQITANMDNTCVDTSAYNIAHVPAPKIPSPR